jgi:hypothetical protein
METFQARIDRTRGRGKTIGCFAIAGDMPDIPGLLYHSALFLIRYMGKTNRQGGVAVAVNDHGTFPDSRKDFNKL